MNLVVRDFGRRSERAIRRVALGSVLSAFDGFFALSFFATGIIIGGVRVEIQFGVSGVVVTAAAGALAGGGGGCCHTLIIRTDTFRVDISHCEIVDSQRCVNAQSMQRIVTLHNNNYYGMYDSCLSLSQAQNLSHYSAVCVVVHKMCLSNTVRSLQQ